MPILYRPNLHAVWDTDIIEHFTSGETPEQVADELESKFKAQIPVWQSQPIDLSAWVWEGHRIAQRIAYGRLPVKVPVEKPEKVDRRVPDQSQFDTWTWTRPEKSGPNMNCPPTQGSLLLLTYGNCCLVSLELSMSINMPRGRSSGLREYVAKTLPLLSWSAGTPTV